MNRFVLITFNVLLLGSSGAFADGEASAELAPLFSSKTAHDETASGQPQSASQRAFSFPLASSPLASYNGGGREFGAPRELGARLHPGVDLLDYPGQAVFAVTDGKILSYAYFNEGTYVITVDHKDFVIRYGELKKMYGGLKVGHHVKSGEKIGIIGALPGAPSMLHLEKYTGQLTGPFWQLNSPYRRRGDLVDPTRFVESLEGMWPNPSS